MKSLFPASPAEIHNAFEPRLTEAIPADAVFCLEHGWYFPVYNAGHRLVCRECMLDDGATAIFTPEGV